VRKIPWRGEWQPTLVSLPEVTQGQRSLAGYSPWGHKELDIIEQLTLSLSVASLTVNSSVTEICKENKFPSSYRSK